MALQDVALIVKLSVSQFYNDQVDERAGRRSNAALGIDTSVVSSKVVRAILPKNALMSVQALVRQLRAFHHSATLPWGDRNHRLLPSAKFMAYSTKVRELKDAIAKAVDDVVAHLEIYKQQAKLAAPSVYREELIPSASALRNMFEVTLSFSPVPDTRDFRLQHVDSNIDEVRRQVQADFSKVLETSAGKQLRVLFLAIADAHAELRDPELRLYSSVINHLRGVAELGASMEPHCPNLGHFSSDVLAALGDQTMDQLRYDAGARLSTAHALSIISTQLGELHGFGKNSSKTD